MTHRSLIGAAIVFALSYTTSPAVASPNNTQTLVNVGADSAQHQALRITDVMQFKSLANTSLSDDGQWVAYQERPDFGDSTGYVYHVASGRVIAIKNASKPLFSPNNKYVAFTISPSLLTREKSSTKQKKKLNNDVVVIELATGKQQRFTAVTSYQFAGLSNAIALKLAAAKKKDLKPQEQDDTEQKNTKTKLFNTKHKTATVTLVNLDSDKRLTFNHVVGLKADPASDLVALATSTPQGKTNSVRLVDMSTGELIKAFAQPKQRIAQLTWSDTGSKLAFLSGSYTKKAAQRHHHVLWWQPKKRLTQVNGERAGWVINDRHALRWSEDNRRLFFAYSQQQEQPTKTVVNQENLYSLARISQAKKLQTWHHLDRQIKTVATIEHKKKSFDRYLAVVNVSSKRITPLASREVKRLIGVYHEVAFVGIDDTPYQSLRTHQGYYFDAYRVDVRSGKKQLIAKKIQNARSIKVSDGGRYISYVKNDQLFVFDSKRVRHKNLSAGLGVSFVDEDNDRPEPARAYGVAGWISGSDNFIAYDKFDMWRFDASSGKGYKLSAGLGREAHRQFRIVNTDNKQHFFDKKQQLLVRSFHVNDKSSGFYNLSLAQDELTPRIEGDKRYRFVAKAKDSDVMLYSQESYRQYPDLWLSDMAISKTHKITDLGKQTQGLAWGHSELIDWVNTDGKLTQGRLIKPDNYQEGKQYPVLVYFYENYSDRLHHFSAMKVNHRPNLPFYASNGYVILLPDIHQIIGAPGPAMVKSIVPGVQKLINMGIAKPDAIGLHGHSWGGYGTAFAVTQTDLFAAAVAGAPVSNMTSAYSGIRLKSGRARQFQYETGQSRLGASLWDKRQRYIDNSPLFFLDKVNTPLLIQFGDADDAVPFSQGVELFLGLRRLQKPAVMLQYEGEPHHLKQYPNKLDYSIKMKQYFDHYLQGKPAPDWLVAGEAYRP